MVDIEDDDNDVECCMTVKQINDKHLALRGSLAYKYPPKEARCREKCELSDMPVLDRDQNLKYAHHGCFLAVGHKSDCEFSSECELSSEKVVTSNAGTN